MLIRCAAVAAILSSTAFGQQPASFRIAVLSATAPSDRDAAFFHALQELGYIEGKNISIERHYLQREPERLPAVAADLVNRKVDVIFAPQTIAALAVKNATRTIPTVFATAPDPVASGLVSSLARPGGNLTGTSSVSTELNAKRLQLLRDAFPAISRLAVFRSSEPIVALHVSEIQRTAKILKLKIFFFELSRPEDIEQRLMELRKVRADGIYVIQSSTNFNNLKLLLDLTARARLPTVYPYSESTEAGGLMSYGADFDDNYRRAAVYVSKILKGTKPMDLPVEQPTKFELVVNLRTARALNLKIAPTVLTRADRIIE